MKRDEDKMQIAIVEYFRYQYPGVIIHHSANGSYKSKAAAGKFKAMGQTAGCPDLLIFKRKFSCGVWCGLAIELKSENGLIRESQTAFMKQLSAEGWWTEVCNSFDQAKSVIDKYMNL